MENKVTKKQIRQKLLVYPLIFGIFFVVIYFILAPSGDKTDDEIKGFNTELPDPENQTIYADKKTAYEQEQLRKQQEDKRLSLEDYAFSLTGKDSSDLKTNDELDLKIDEPQIAVSDQEITDRNTLVASGLAYQNMNRELSSFYQQSQDSEKKQLEQKVEELTKRLEAKENTVISPDHQMDMIEKSYKLAAKYFNTGTPHSEQTLVQSDPESDKPDEIISHDEHLMLYSITGNTENIVSRLPQQVSDSAFISDYTKPRHEGFYSAIKPYKATNRNTIRACVFENQTLTFGNGEDQKVRFRLLENVRAGNFLLPRNSLFTGDAKIQGGRLDITINSIEYAGNIIAVKIQVYDTDGQRGIRAPGSEETNALKEAAGNMGQQLGTSITFTQNAGQQVAADLAKGAIETGSQYLSKKMKTVKIHLKADHEVLLLASDK